MVGGIPVEDGVGREVISRFDSSIKSNGHFYTDANGREMQRRQRNHRETWPLQIDEQEQIAGNYFPVTSKIAIEDAQTRLAILNDRAQGGSSLSDGSVEIMVHRRLMHDDNCGVNEALNETAFGQGLVARGVHYLSVTSKKSAGNPFSHASERFIQVNKHLPAWLFVSDTSRLSYETWRSSFTNTVSLYRMIASHLLSQIYTLI